MCALGDLPAVSALDYRAKSKEWAVSFPGIYLTIQLL